MRTPEWCLPFAAALFVVLAIAPPVVPQTAVPLLINCQGELRSPTTGDPVPDGSYDMVFRIFDAESAGTALWDGTHTAANGNPVQVTDRIFSVTLGSGTGNALDGSLFDGAERWLETAIGTETLSPRQRITSVAYSIISENSRLLAGREAEDFANIRHVHSGSEITSGTVLESWIDPSIASDSELAVAIADHSDIPDAHHAKTTSLPWGSITSIPAGFADGIDNDSGGDITGVTAGAGLTGGGAAGGVTLSAEFGGSGSANTAAHSDHGHGGAYWLLTGNTGTSGANFLGTTDNQPIELRVNNGRALRLEPNADSPNVIGGHSGNSASIGVVGAAIGGGGVAGLANRVTDHCGTVGGGTGNTAGDAAGLTDDRPYATVGGGWANTASGQEATVSGGGSNAASGGNATVAGGYNNTASGYYTTVGGGYGNATTHWAATVGGGGYNQANASYATIAGGGPSDPGDPDTTRNLVTDDYGTIGGGGGNQAGDNAGTTDDAHYATVGGGRLNTAGGDYATVAGGLQNSASADFATVAGGYDNTASADDAAVGGGYQNVASGMVATVPGGEFNEAIGYCSFAAGSNAHANGAGSFVWADQGFFELHAWNPNEFVVRAKGGFWFITKVDNTGYPIEGMMLPAGSSEWVPIGIPAAQLSPEQSHPIQELEAENTSLKQRIDELESRLLALEALMQSRGGDQK